MRIAYLVLAHRDPEGLAWLLHQLLRQPGAAGFVHLDRKAADRRFEAVASIDSSRICFLERRRAVYWGDFSQVEAILDLVQAALDDPRGFDRLVLLSGADVPLRSPESIEQFFVAHPRTEFINLVSIPNAALGKPLSRIARYQPREGDSLASRASVLLLQRLGVRPKMRDHCAVLGDLAPHGGSTWWALTRAASAHVVDFAAREVAVTRFFENTVSPDESFVHTILANSSFRPHVRRNLTYTDWRAGGRSPAWLGFNHLELLRSQPRFSDGDAYGPGEILFARKLPENAGDLRRAFEELALELDRQPALAQSWA